MNARAERAAMLLLPLLTLLSPRPTSAAGAAVPPPGWLHDLWTTQGLFEGDGSKASAASRRLPVRFLAHWCWSGFFNLKTIS